jgi:hypothetical protein
MWWLLGEGAKESRAKLSKKRLFLARGMIFHFPAVMARQMTNFISITKPRVRKEFSSL